MFIDKTGKSTFVKRSLVFFIISLSFSVLTGGNAFAEHYLNHGVRESLSNEDKIALVHEEYRDLSWYEVKNKVKDMKTVSNYENPGIKGSVRAHLSISEKVNLLKEEDKSLKNPEILVMQSTIHEEVNGSRGSIHAGTPYVYGSFRANLSDAEKKQLAREEQQSNNLNLGS